MIELVPKSLTDKLSSSAWITTHRHNWSSDSSGSGLLSPGGSPPLREGHRRHPSHSRFKPRRALWTAGAIAFLTVIALCWSLFPARIDQRLEIPEPDVDHGDGADAIDSEAPIPPGKSVERNGREVFWWEQFPRLHGLFRGRKNIVPFSAYVPEQKTSSFDPFDPGDHDEPRLLELLSPLPPNFERCYLDEERKILPPTVSAYEGLPQGMSSPLFGSQKELGLNEEVCYDRVNRLAPYGLGVAEELGGLGTELKGDNSGLEEVAVTDWRGVRWHDAQTRCFQRNSGQITSRSALVFRTWSTFKYTKYHIAMIRAIISELALATGGQYTVHFLIHVQDDTIPIWASSELYNKALRDSLPEEFQGMGMLWSVAQMKLIYPPPFPDSLVNFSGGDIYEAYRSLHFPLQYFAERHPEYDYFWQWEMDMRVTGHHHELLSQISSWAEQQPRDHAWERSSRFYIPSLYDDSYERYAQAVVKETRAANGTPIAGPQIPPERLLDIPQQAIPDQTDEITDLITFNPLFNPENSRWAFHNDITGYNVTRDGRPPTRAALITASRLSRRLLLLMHEETYANKHTMFPEMFPASIALHYGLKAVYAPIPVYFDRNWPSAHADEVFNNAPVSLEDEKAGMDHGNGHFHGEGGSVFGPGEHVFRGATYYSNAGFAGYLWRRWLGRENGNDEINWELEDGLGGGRMCLPNVILHPVKFD
ncbi:hypothetical protein G647_09826 [Cladophialophora carrionii CBS 160.54]|uniref:Uncharacterized protein n=1 Tax=Cladophialophora carrionii CBS 160.54 TaxID=1279043 RepID=V9DJR6_9EURO|nr:uncharacterized protein G647_09826 [Cladophialophora carrionii CBS 160.54]ETI27144.1 hypothetical protein G647_09826 [Cladophialophora carrionii CBS 160.54]